MIQLSLTVPSVIRILKGLQRGIRQLCSAFVTIALATAVLLVSLTFLFLIIEVKILMSFLIYSHIGEGNVRVFESNREITSDCR